MMCGILGAAILSNGHVMSNTASATAHINSVVLYHDQLWSKLYFWDHSDTTEHVMMTV